MFWLCCSILLILTLYTVYTYETVQQYDHTITAHV